MVGVVVELIVGVASVRCDEEAFGQRTESFIYCLGAPSRKKLRHAEYEFGPFHFLGTTQTVALGTVDT